MATCCPIASVLCNVKPSIFVKKIIVIICLFELNSFISANGFSWWWAQQSQPWAKSNKTACSFCLGVQTHHFSFFNSQLFFLVQTRKSPKNTALLKNKANADDAARTTHSTAVCCKSNLESLQRIRVSCKMPCRKISPKPNENLENDTYSFKSSQQHMCMSRNFYKRRRTLIIKDEWCGEWGHLLMTWQGVMPLTSREPSGRRCTLPPAACAECSEKHLPSPSSTTAWITIGKTPLSKSKLS